MTQQDLFDLDRIEAHEKQCAQRHQQMLERLENIEKKFESLEQSIQDISRQVKRNFALS